MTQGSHLEKLCLIDDGVGRDMISDFTTNLIKRYLLEYTQTFARKHLALSQRKRVAVPKVSLNYATEAWQSEAFELPHLGGDYVILRSTPICRVNRQSFAPGSPVGDSGPMHGPDILARTLSVAVPTGASRALWQYHSRGDRHSKVACWGILFDLLQQCSTLTEHVRSGRVACGINHEMKDFKQGRKKNLDLVLCVPGTNQRAPKRAEGFKAMVERHSIVLNAAERTLLDGLPDIPEAPVGSVHVALEAKACMTEHIKAMPRLYDELNSSHLTIHGSSEMVIAVGFVMVNIASTFQSPSRSTVTKHRQPFVAEKVVAKVRELPRRSSVADTGFDAMSIVVVDCQNDGSPVQIRTSPPAPAQGDIFHYDSMIHRLAQLYASRFPRI